MKKIYFMGLLSFCIIFSGTVLAQENKSVASILGNAVSSVVNNQEAVNDEGYGLDDTEYYGAENQELNGIDDSEDEYNDADINYEELMNEDDDAELDADMEDEVEEENQVNAVKSQGNAAVSSVNETTE